MIKKRTALLILSFLMAIILPAQAMAADVINTTETCTFSVSFIAGEEKAQGVEFRIYRIADVSPTGDINILERFKSYPISYNDLSNSDTWEKLAQTLMGYIVSDKLPADATSKTSTDGRAYFYDLPVGLYLVDGDQYISGRTTYTPNAFIAGEPIVDDNGEWRYDVTAMVKYIVLTESKNEEPEDEHIELDILKIWNDGGNPNRPEDIAVELYENGELYDIAVLSKLNNWKHKFTDLNKTSVWTVKETTVEDGYTVSIERQDNCFVLTNTMTDTSINPPPENDGTLPQTGLLWWPVPCLLAGGLLIIIIGILCRRGAVNEK